MSKAKKTDYMSTMFDLATLMSAVVNAFQTEDPEHVDDVLPGDLRITIAKHAADMRARAKFGS